MENSSDASSQSSLDTSYGTSHTSPEVSMEYELSHFADDSRFDQVSHETDMKQRYIQPFMCEPLIASNSDTDPEHDSDSSEDGCSIW